VFIVSKHISYEALKILKKLDSVLLFETENITYPAISCHPDIFFCKAEKTIITSPNTPEKYLKAIQTVGKNVISGLTAVGKKYPDTARYNAVITSKYLIHKKQITDTVITNYCTGKKIINIPQGYTRCSLLPLNEKRYITSDEAIFKTLKNKGLAVLYVNPKNILLPGFTHGFIGGTAGVFQNKVLFNGSLKNHQDGEKIRKFINNSNMKIIELHNGPLCDIGSILSI